MARRAQVSASELAYEPPPSGSVETPTPTDAKSQMHEARVWGLNLAAPSAHIPEMGGVIHSTLELCVLLLRQTQEHPTPADGDALFQHQ